MRFFCTECGGRDATYYGTCLNCEGSYICEDCGILCAHEYAERTNRCYQCGHKAERKEREKAERAERERIKRLTSPIKTGWW